MARAEYQFATMSASSAPPARLRSVPYARAEGHARRVEPPVPAEQVHWTVLYYDIFSHPLTVAELEQLCGGSVAEALVALEAAGSVEREGPYVCRAGQRAHVPRRRARTVAAEEMWGEAQWAAALLARVPFVRGVLVTGGLSKRSSSRGGDVDFLLLVEPGWVWTTKSALQGVRRGMPERVRNLFCTNYLLATDHLLVDDRNAFTAMELATAVPVYGPEACVAFLEANRWAEAIVPGVAWNLERARHALPVHPPTAIERALGPGRARLESTSRAAWARFWDRKYDWLEDGDRARRFKRRPELATNHLHDFQRYVLAELAARCAAEGIAPR